MFKRRSIPLLIASAAVAVVNVIHMPRADRASADAPLASSVPAMTGDAIGHAEQHQINGSGIEGHIFIVDNGSKDSVLGVATGMDPTKNYFSLFYDKGSVPGGPDACEPPANSDLTGAQMFIGVWTVSADGTGTLVRPSKTGAAYVALSDVGTVSIRKSTPGENPPHFNVLQACGEVVRNPL